MKNDSKHLDDGGGFAGVPRCKSCGRPENDHNVRHPFVHADGWVGNRPAQAVTAADKLRDLGCAALDALHAVYEHRRRHAPTTEWHNRARELDSYFIDAADAALAQVSGTLTILDESKMLQRDAQLQAMDRGASYQAAVAERDEAREQLVELMKYVDAAKLAGQPERVSGEPLADFVKRVMADLTSVRRERTELISDLVVADKHNRQLQADLDDARAKLREATNLDDRDAQLLIMRRALRAALSTWCPNDPRGDGADGDTYRMCHAALQGKDGR